MEVRREGAAQKGRQTHLGRSGEPAAFRGSEGPAVESRWQQKAPLRKCPPASCQAELFKIFRPAA